MAMPTDAPIPFSLLDRLTTPAEETRIRGREIPDMGYLRDSIRTDIEALLNMRRRCLSISDALTEARDSIITFGIPDFSGANLSSEEQRNAFRSAIEEAIMRHEPRVHFVAVRLTNQAEQLERTLRFQIDIYIKSNKENQPKLVFQSTVDPLTNSVKIESGQGYG